MVQPLTRFSERDGGKVRCFSLSCPRYFMNEGGNLAPVRQVCVDAASTIGDITLWDKNVASVGVRKDGALSKYLGIRPDVNQTLGTEQLEFSIDKVTFDGVEQDVDTSKNDVLDASTIDVGSVIVRTGRIETRQLVKATNQVTTFEVEYTLHVKGMTVKERYGEFWFFSGDEFRFKIRKPLLLDAAYQKIFAHELVYPNSGTCSQCGLCCLGGGCEWLGEDKLCTRYEDRPPVCVNYPQPDDDLPDGCTMSPAFVEKDLAQPLVVHSLVDNEDGTYTYKKTSTELFSKAAPYLPDRYYIDADTYYSTTADGRVRLNNATSWSDARDGTIGTIADDTQSSAVSTFMSRFNTDKGGDTWDVCRGFFFFDTSAVSNTIRTATLNIYGFSNADTSVTAQEGTQASTLTTSDFDAFKGDAFGSVSWVTGAYNTITFNEAGRDAINAGGTTRICGRESSYDVADVDPDDAGGSDTEYSCGCYFADNTGTAEDPYLEITESWLHKLYGIASSAITSISTVVIGAVRYVNNVLNTWDPSDLDTVEAWFDASDYNTITESSGSATAWADKTDNSYDLSGTGTYHNTGFDGTQLPYMDFNGSSNTMNRSGITGSASGDWTVFAMVDVTADGSTFDYLFVTGRDSNEQRFIIEEGSSDDNTFYRYAPTLPDSSKTARVSGVQQLTWEADSTNNKFLLYRDGTNLVDQSSYNIPGPSLDGNMSLGSRTASDYYHGKVAEVVMVNEILSTEDRQRMEGYLAWKWSGA
jgi:hypothetical protein